MMPSVSTSIAIPTGSRLKQKLGARCLQHGYAYRGAKYYNRSIPIRDLAALMGHDVRTQMKHYGYGQWTDDEGLMASVQAITKSAASQSRRPKSLNRQQMQQQH